MKSGENAFEIAFPFKTYLSLAGYDAHVKRYCQKEASHEKTNCRS